MGMLGKRSFAWTKSKAIDNAIREVKQSFQYCNNGQGNRPMNFQSLKICNSHVSVGCGSKTVFVKQRLLFPTPYILHRNILPPFLELPLISDTNHWQSYTECDVNLLLGNCKTEQEVKLHKILTSALDTVECVVRFQLWPVFFICKELYHPFNRRLIRSPPPPNTHTQITPVIQPVAIQFTEWVIMAPSRYSWTWI